jgi:hypothetical protein
MPQGFGLYMYKALTAGRHFNLLALACLTATFVVMDGPLLQRASTVHLGTSDRAFNLSVSITPEIPAYWTGWVQFFMMPYVEGQQVQAQFLPVYSDTAADRPMKGGISGCPPHSTCRAVVRAPALEVLNCTSVIKPRDYLAHPSKAQAESFGKGCF